MNINSRSYPLDLVETDINAFQKFVYKPVLVREMDTLSVRMPLSSPARAQGASFFANDKWFSRSCSSKFGCASVGFRSGTKSSRKRFAYFGFSAELETRFDRGAFSITYHRYQQKGDRNGALHFHGLYRPPFFVTGSDYLDPSIDWDLATSSGVNGGRSQNLDMQQRTDESYQLKMLVLEDIILLKKKKERKKRHLVLYLYRDLHLRCP